MLSNRLTATIGLAVSAAIAFFARTDGRVSIAPAAADDRARSGRGLTQEDDHQQVVYRTYELSYRRAVKVGGDTGESIAVRAQLSIEPLARPGHYELSLREVAVEGSAPPAEQLATRFQISVRGGRIVGAGFLPDRSHETRRLLFAMAVAIWYSDGDGRAWTATEEDLTGLYEAIYIRDPSKGTVERRRHFVAVRAGTRLDRHRSTSVMVEGGSEFQADRAGLVSLRTDETLFSQVGTPRIRQMALEVAASRLAVHWREARDGPFLPVTPLEEATWRE